VFGPTQLSTTTALYYIKALHAIGYLESYMLYANERPYLGMVSAPHQKDATQPMHSMQPNWNMTEGQLT
jgi:hypothetical protein